MKKVVLLIFLLAANWSSAQDAECERIDRNNLAMCVSDCVMDGGNQNSWETLGKCIIAINSRIPSDIRENWPAHSNGLFTNRLNQPLLCSEGSVDRTPVVHVRCKDGYAEIDYFGCFADFKLTTYKHGQLHNPPVADFKKITSYSTVEPATKSVTIPLPEFLRVDALGFEIAGFDNAPQTTFFETEGLRPKIVANRDYCDF